MLKFLFGVIAGIAICVLAIIIRLAVENWDDNLSDKYNYIDED